MEIDACRPRKTEEQKGERERRRRVTRRPVQGAVRCVFRTAFTFAFQRAIGVPWHATLTSR
jgi:hypothetical protein